MPIILIREIKSVEFVALKKYEDFYKHNFVSDIFFMI